MPATVDSYYLVQRLKKGSGRKPGFDGHFDLDYMGSAEFEFGAVPASLKEIRAAGSIEILESTVTVNATTRAVFFVGPAAWLAARAEPLQDWVDGGCRGKERTFFAEQVDGSADEWMAETIAWWSLINSIAWTLDADVAATLVTAFAAQPAKV